MSVGLIWRKEEEGGVEGGIKGRRGRAWCLLRRCYPVLEMVLIDGPLVTK